MNLANDIDVEETEAEIKKFKEKNSDLIEKNKKKVCVNVVTTLLLKQFN